MPTRPSLLPCKRSRLWLGALGLAAFFLPGQLRQHQTEEVNGKIEHVLTPLEGNPISPGYVQQRIERYATKARISKNIHPYTLRRSFATALCRKTARIRLVQKALGHASLSTTRIYTHIVDEELEDALKPFRQPTAVAV